MHTGARRLPASRALVLAGLTAGLLGVSACSSPQSPPSVPSVTTTVTVTSTATASPEASSESPTPTQAPSTSALDPPVRSVDPESYRGQDRNDGYFFTSPSGNLSCGILDGGVTGCQAWSLVANLPECDKPQTNSSPAIEFTRGQQASGFCLSEGAFFSEALILEYGREIHVAGITCSSELTGVTCIEESTGLGFTAARAGFTPIG